jgi:DNA-binding PadR family transcriptional regulator
MTSTVLTQRLRQMERDGLVVRTHHAEIPPRVEYEIGELGRSLSSVFRPSRLVAGAPQGSRPEGLPTSPILAEGGTTGQAALRGAD